VTLIRTSLLNVIAVAIRMLSLLGLNKVLAVSVGPSGYALIGQLQNFITTVTAVASAGVATGITKYTAEYGAASQVCRKVWVTAGFIGALSSVVLACGLMVFRNELSYLIFRESGYAGVFVWISAGLGLYVLNAFLLAILNGLKRIGTYVLANILNSVVAFVVTGLLAHRYGLYGAFVALAINQSVACLVTVALVLRESWFKASSLIGWPERGAAVKLANYAIMALAASVIGPLALIAVRNVVVHDLGVEAAGYWEALVRISNLYLMFISTPLSVYYLPRLSELKTAVDLRRELAVALKILVPVAAALALMVYVFRGVMVEILFSSEFAPIEELLAWQLLGDVVRAAAWLFSFFLISRAMTRYFVAAEIAGACTFIMIATVAIGFLGAQGIVVAYAINNILYLAIVFFMAQRVFRRIELSDR
jgi:PST family polysaccharide transporter